MNNLQSRPTILHAVLRLSTTSCLDAVDTIDCSIALSCLRSTCFINHNAHCSPVSTIRPTCISVDKGETDREAQLQWPLIALCTGS